MSIKLRNPEVRKTSPADDVAGTTRLSCGYLTPRCPGFLDPVQVPHRADVYHLLVAGPVPAAEPVIDGVPDAVGDQQVAHLIDLLARHQHVWPGFELRLDGDLEPVSTVQHRSSS